MIVHYVCLVQAILMNPLPLLALFHPSTQVSPPVVPILVVLPSLVYATPVPSKVTPLAHETLSLFPPFSISLSAIVRFVCHVVASLPLLPKILSTQVGLLET